MFAKGDIVYSIKNDFCTYRVDGYENGHITVTARYAVDNNGDEYGAYLGIKFYAEDNLVDDYFRVFEGQKRDAS